MAMVVLVDRDDVLGVIAELNETSAATTRRVARRLGVDPHAVQSVIEELLGAGRIQASDPDWFVCVPRGEPRYWPTGTPPAP